MNKISFFKSNMPEIMPFEPVKFAIRIDDDSNEENINTLLSITLYGTALLVIYFLLFPFFMKMISPSEERIREDNNPVMRATFG